MRALLPASLLALAAAAAVAQTPAAPSPPTAIPPPPSMPLVFKGGDGLPHGAGALTVAPDGVLVRLDLTGLKPGWHAVHFHQKADCSDAALMNSGGHVKAAGVVKPHGFLNPGASDAGDLPNVWAGADGTAHAEMFTRTVSGRGEGGRAPLMDADGSALIVHASPDDYVSQPLGGAGARVACALISAPT